MMFMNYNLYSDTFRSDLSKGFTALQQQQEFVDVTLAAEGHLVKAHQNILALASPYIKAMLRSAPCQHPVIFLSNVGHEALSFILQYVYSGEVQVPRDAFSSFLEAAKLMHIVGLEHLSVPKNIMTLHKTKDVKKKSSAKLMESIGQDTKEIGQDIAQFEINNDAVENVTTQNIDLHTGAPSYDENDTEISQNTTEMVDYEDDENEETNATEMVDYKVDINQETNATEMVDYKVDINQETNATEINDFEDDINQETNATEINDFEDDINQETNATEMVDFEDDINQETSATEMIDFEDSIHLERNATLILKENDHNYHSKPDNTDINVTSTQNLDLLTTDSDMQNTVVNISYTVTHDQEPIASIKLQGDAPNVAYTKSIRGSVQMILNRFLYNMHYEADGGRKRRWRCLDYRRKKCLAYVDTYDGTPVKRKNEHKHAFHDEKILKSGKKSLFSKLNDEKTKVKKKIDT